VRPSQPKPELVNDAPSLRASALRWLARREYSVFELTQKLIQRGYDPDTAEQVVADLAKERLVSDERCAEAVTRSAMQRGHGPTRLRHQLQQLGLDQQLIDISLEIDAEAWAQQLQQVWEKRFGEQAANRKEWAKQARFLQSRGFTSEQICRFLNSLDNH
jgi:regulatory protein